MLAKIASIPFTVIAEIVILGIIRPAAKIAKFFQRISRVVKRIPNYVARARYGCGYDDAKVFEYYLTCMIARGLDMILDAARNGHMCCPNDMTTEEWIDKLSHMAADWKQLVEWFGFADHKVEVLYYNSMVDLRMYLPYLRFYTD